jgi:hypothetical protein
MRAVFVLSAVAAALAFACGDSLSGLTSNAGDDGGASDAGGTDGGVALDANIGDSSSASDADSGAGAFCSTLTPAPEFCDDFDDTMPLAQKWNTITADKGAATKMNGALRLTNDALVSMTDEGKVWVSRSLPRPPTIEVSFAFFTDAQTTFPRSLANVRLESGSAFYQVETWLGANMTEISVEEWAQPGLGDAGSLSTKVAFEGNVVGQWKNARLEITFQGSPRAKLWIDNAAFPNIDMPITPTITSTMAEVQVGAIYLRGPMAASGYSLDNVVIRAK